MLAELQAVSIRVEVGVQALFKAVPHVINKYNYHNKDSDEIINSKRSKLTEIEVDVRNCLQDLQTFDTLLKDSLLDVEDVSTTLETIVKRLKIDYIPKIESSSVPSSDKRECSPSTTLNDDNKENSADISISPLVLICRQREDTVSETPAVKCEKKSRLPLRNRIEFHKENFN